MLNLLIKFLQKRPKTMLLNRLYYVLKPLLPWSVRIGLRRLRGAAKRKRCADVWPINPEAGKVPPSWPGWPEGKRFGFVLTHDVEGTRGYDRVEQLMKLEAEHGFRSCFNFVPEREYRVSDQLRNKMDQAGFEVGVHGLKHDGKLYSSKAEFASRAARIREYADRWNATGFRSPLMQHRLDWLHLLGMEYDSSTFDTDPFEPEPDGVGTIFPFWVAGPDDTGYVELPYTLVQDISLFVILGEKTIDIWKKKIDWIAERGGMVLLNTHPDYMCFGGKAADDEFPVELYVELLQYVKEKYAGQYWAALPREVNGYYRSAVPVAERNTRKKVCMLAYTGYEGDNRVRRYAEALVKRGDHVDAIAYSSGEKQPDVETISGVTVYRVQRRDYNERSKWTYAYRLLRFLVVSSIQLTRLHRQHRYDVIHIHNPPDFMVFAAWYPRLRGARLILDIHDITPELYASKFEAAQENTYVKLLKVGGKIVRRGMRSRDYLQPFVVGQADGPLCRKGQVLRLH